MKNTGELLILSAYLEDKCKKKKNLPISFASLNKNSIIFYSKYRSKPILTRNIKKFSSFSSQLITSLIKLSLI